MDTSKRVLAESDKPEVDESSEFSQARQAALAQALEAKNKVTKTFTKQVTVFASRILWKNQAKSHSIYRSSWFIRIVYRKWKNRWRQQRPWRHLKRTSPLVAHYRLILIAGRPFPPRHLTQSQVHRYVLYLIVQVTDDRERFDWCCSSV